MIFRTQKLPKYFLCVVFQCGYIFGDFSGSLELIKIFSIKFTVEKRQYHQIKATSQSTLFLTCRRCGYERRSDWL